jgi:hypothetical protein
VEGLPRASIAAPTPLDRPTLVIRPWHQAGNVVSLREFTNNAFNQHHGMQPTGRFGVDSDPDGDGVRNELTRADITAITLFQAAMAVPGQVVPNDPAIEQAVLNGEKVFDTIGCSSCHIPKLALRDNGWIFTEPNPYNPSTNLRVGTTKTVSVDLNSADQYDQDSLIEFLKTLQVLPPGTPYLVVDENFREKKWSLSSQLNSRTVEKK